MGVQVFMCVWIDVNLVIIFLVQLVMGGLCCFIVCVIGDFILLEFGLVEYFICGGVEVCCVIWFQGQLVIVFSVFVEGCVVFNGQLVG